jgi:alanyl aminopeptidase
MNNTVKRCLYFSGFLIAFLFTSQVSFASEQNHRLPEHITATSQYINLILDPELDDYSGNTVVDIKLSKSTDRIGIHWKDLTVNSIVLVSGNDERVLSATAGEFEINWLSDSNAIKPGKYQLKIEFSAKYSSDALGLYKIKYQDQNYLSTQFEALYARRAFPIFDEPDVKIPYQLTLTVPKNLKVATNTPVLNKKVNGDNKTVSFKKTPPMSSYLIALIVGDFDKTPITGLSVPGYIYSPKGTGGETGFTIKHTPKIFKALETYFGIDYPYEKLDFVAVPDFAFGAMENAGLVTYRTELLLVGDTATANQAEDTLNVIAHELAHMWYGDLVTMKWWDDLWLNEAFATWMAQKVLAQYYPQYQSNLNLPQEGAFYEDGLAATKPIRKEIITEDDITDGLGLNYTKGHAILSMIEQTIGEDNFQKAVQKYMKKHSWKNTVADDLWQAFAEHSTFDITDIADTFLNQAGYASVNFNEKGEVTQKRFRNYGSEMAEQNWLIPLTIKYKLNGEIAHQQLLLTDKKLTAYSLIEADWFLPVTNGNGYFRWKMPEKQFNALLEDMNELTDREKLALLSNSRGLLASGEITISEHLALLTQLTKELNPIVFLKALELIKLIGESHVGINEQQAFANYITKTLTPWYERIGSHTKDTDDDAILQLRPRLLRTLGQLGNNPDLNIELTKMANQYLAGDQKIDDNLGREALRIAAMLDNDSLVKKYYDTYSSTSDASLKSNIMTSIYFTSEKSVAYVLDKMLDKNIPAGDKAGPFGGTFYINKDQTQHYQWMDKNFDLFVKSLPQVYQSYFPLFMTANCQENNVNLLKSFFDGKGEVYKASLNKSLETENNCLAMKKREANSFAEFLSDYK